MGRLQRTLSCYIKHAYLDLIYSCGVNYRDGYHHIWRMILVIIMQCFNWRANLYCRTSKLAPARRTCLNQRTLNIFTLISSCLRIVSISKAENQRIVSCALASILLPMSFATVATPTSVGLMYVHYLYYLLWITDKQIVFVLNIIKFHICFCDSYLYKHEVCSCGNDI
jgi:hypothetical protein